MRNYGSGFRTMRLIRKLSGFMNDRSRKRAVTPPNEASSLSQFLDQWKPSGSKSRAQTPLFRLGSDGQQFHPLARSLSLRVSLPEGEIDIAVPINCRQVRVALL